MGLDPDEIRIKLDQVMEWNDLPTQKGKPNKRYLEVAKDNKKWYNDDYERHRSTHTYWGEKT